MCRFWWLSRRNWTTKPSTWLSSARAAGTACPTCTPAWIPSTWTRFECVPFNYAKLQKPFAWTRRAELIEVLRFHPVKPRLFVALSARIFVAINCDSLPLRSTPWQNTGFLRKKKGASCDSYAVLPKRRDVDVQSFMESRFGSDLNLNPRKTDLKNSRQLGFGFGFCKYYILLSIII